jgi:hypothetical protein
MFQFYTFIEILQHSLQEESMRFREIKQTLKNLRQSAETHRVDCYRLHLILLARPRSIPKGSGQ